MGDGPAGGVGTPNGFVSAGAPRLSVAQVSRGGADTLAMLGEQA